MNTKTIIYKNGWLNVPAAFLLDNKWICEQFHVDELGPEKAVEIPQQYWLNYCVGDDVKGVR